MSAAYSIFDMDNENLRNMFGLNPIHTSADFVHFTIIRAREKRIHISIHKDQSLWDFYEKCYFTIYPDVNREQFITREPVEKCRLFMIYLCTMKKPIRLNRFPLIE